MTTMSGMIVESGGGGGEGRRGRVPPVTNLGGDVSSRFENEVAQIRCLFRFLGYFGGRSAATVHPREARLL